MCVEFDNIWVCGLMFNVFMLKMFLDKGVVFVGVVYSGIIIVVVNLVGLFYVLVVSYVFISWFLSDCKWFKNFLCIVLFDMC